jgi:hypothetical protein
MLLIVVTGTRHTRSSTTKEILHFSLVRHLLQTGQQDLEPGPFWDPIVIPFAFIGTCPNNFSTTVGENGVYPFHFLITLENHLPYR